MRMRIIVNQLKILELKLEDRFFISIDQHARQIASSPAQLQFGLLEMIELKMGITKGMNKITWIEITHLRHHHCQKRIRGNIERNTQKHIG